MNWAKVTAIRISLSIILVGCLTLPCLAAVHQVGAGQEYANPNELYSAGVVENGDTILIDSGIYRGTEALAVWLADNLLIRGIGGTPELYAEGTYIRGKGIWVAVGDNITIENIAFNDAAVPDRNGAGIRLDGSGLTVRNCLFRNNENGILTNNTGAGHVRVEYSEFDGSGFGDGQSHNLYVGRVDSFSFIGNWSHRADIGHLLKSRAKVNLIYYNRISDEEGNSSRLIDLPDGGESYIIGNVLVQGENAVNSNFIGYGLEGYRVGYVRELYVVNNTLVNNRRNGLFFHIQPEEEKVSVSNNLLVGPGNIVNGVISDSSNNLRINRVEEVHFVDPQNYDYHLLDNSPAIDAGADLRSADGAGLVPNYVYVHPTQSRTRMINGNTFDVGAYELTNTVRVRDRAQESLRIFPNPTTGVININLPDELDVAEWRIVDFIGRTVKSSEKKLPVSLAGLKPGAYRVVVESLRGKHYHGVVLLIQ